MKKMPIIIIVCVIFVGRLNAQQQVSKTEASNAAISTLYNKVDILQKALDTKVDTIYSFHSSRNNILMYEVVFTNRVAILLSGSKACLPILGYFIKPDHDNSAIFDTTNTNVPCCLQNFLYDYIQQIEWSFAQNNMVLHYERQWKELQQINLVKGNSKTTINVQPLLKTIWSQSKATGGGDCNAYNYFVTQSSQSCDCLPSKHCPAGCVAVAMGQIMKYWNHPVYQENMHYQYDWCNMQDTLYYRIPPLYNTLNPNYEKERDAIARLLKDCGEKVNMMYCQNNTCQSAAYNEDTRKALVNDFGYNSNATLRSKSSYKIDAWKSLIKDHLSQSIPIYYSGSGSEGGHAFVCDGYDSDDYFHFNWGWGGSYHEDWFTLNNLNIAWFDFNSSQQAIFNIYPENHHSYCNFSLPLWMHYFSYYTLLGNSFPPPHLNVPKTFTVLESVPESSSASWRTIESGQSAEYIAHEAIILKPGFHAQTGSHFIARVDPCLSCDETSKSMLFLNNDDNPGEKIFEVKNSDSEAILQDVFYNTKEFKLYPNPNPGTFQLETNFSLTNIGNLKITNLVGTSIYDTQNVISHTIQLSHPTAGMFFVIMVLKDGTILTQKMIVQ